jgi:hypothetical protein
MSNEIEGRVDDLGIHHCEAEIMKYGETAKLLQALLDDPACRADVREVLSDLVVIANKRIRQLAARREARLKRLMGSMVR